MSLSQQCNSRDERQEATRANNATILASETLRHGAAVHHRKRGKGDKEENKISVFWRVFGGTILSIGALVGLTTYNNLTATLTDLRKDLNNQIETRTDLVKKDDLNTRCTSLWASVKELQTAGGAMTALTERAKSLEQQIKMGQEDRKELHRKLEEQCRTLQEECKEYSRKLEEQRKAAEEERKEWSRAVQKLAERLAAVEGRQAVNAAAKSAEISD
jgi:chromosome segregation ATPase